MSIEPTSGPAFISLARVQWDLGNIEDAERQFLNGIELSPNYATAYQWYGEFLAAQGRNDDSLAFLRKALEKDPGSASIKASLAEELRWTGRLNEGRDLLLKSVVETPEFPPYYLELLINFGIDGKFAEALRWANAGRNVAPHHRYLKALRCLVLLNLDEDTEAEKCAKSLEDEFPIPYTNFRAILLLLRGDLDSAAALLEEQPSQGIARPAYLYSQARLYLELGNPEKALQEIGKYDHSLLAGPITVTDDNWDIAFVAAMARYETGSQTEANEAFDEILQYYEDTPMLHPLVEFPPQAYIYAIRKDKGALIRVLRDAVDSGWRNGWFGLKFRYFDFARDDPEFVEIVSHLEAHAAHERELYTQKKDQPLF